MNSLGRPGNLDTSTSVLSSAEVFHVMGNMALKFLGVLANFPYSA